MSYIWKPEPTWLTSACMRAIHDIIMNKKICLKLHKSMLKKIQFQHNKNETIVAIIDENEDK